MEEIHADGEVAMNLDRLSSLIIATDPESQPALERLRAELLEASLSGELDELQRHFITGAADQIATILQGLAPDPEEVLSGVGRLIDVATTMSAGTVEAAPTAPRAPEAGGAAVAEPETFFPDDIEESMLEDFLSESRENVHFAEASLLALETDPEDTEAINTIFRAFHTLKGMAAFLNFKHMADLAHHSESFLSKIRDGAARYSEESADIALRSVDLMKEILDIIKASKPGGVLLKPEGYDEHLRSFEALASGAPKRLGEILIAAGKAKAEDVEAAAEAADGGRIGVELLKAGAASASDVGQALRKQKREKEADTADGSMRIKIERMDRLFNLVGELVISQSMMDEEGVSIAMERPLLSSKIQQAGKVVRELQNICMSMRMVPLKATFQKMARLCRDLSRKNGKKIRFITSGEETEIDRTLVEVVGEFLVHMVRNAADHGIEDPYERDEAGKNPEGEIRLSAAHSGGNVVFEIADDGRGLNRDKILGKAIEKGLVDAEKALTDTQIFNLIFEPGFSTADTITDVSGRGVGMDVVRTGIEALKGRIEIQTTTGKGSLFIMRVPLTMAITDAMIVRAGAERYIIPTIKIKQSIRPASSELSTCQGQAEMFIFMNELIPVVRLHRLFGLDGAVTDLREGILIVVEETAGRYALLVDEIIGQAQVVAKTLGEAFGKVQGISSGAILGDGRVGLILDTAELAGLKEEGVDEVVS